MKHLCAASLATFLWAANGTALATPVLSVTPASQTVASASTTRIDLSISGLGNFLSSSLSTFDIFLSYDPAILSLNNTSIGDPALGDQLDVFGFGTINGVDTTTPGSVELYDISFDFPSDLNDFQPGAFTLASLSFNALSAGTSALDITLAILGDEYGDALSADIVNGSITVQSATSVPEPPTSLLLAAGLGLMLLARSASSVRPRRQLA